MASVLIVQNEEIVAEGLAAYVRRIGGFAVAGAVWTGAEALRRLELERIDLVLLEICLSDISGVDVLQAMRASGCVSDVIVVTGARDLRLVQTVAAYGILHYVVKPFTFTLLRDRLERYRSYRDCLSVPRPFVTQGEIDQILGAVHLRCGTELPTAVSRETLYAVSSIVREAATDASAMTASEVAVVLGASRVTARRYLEYLTEVGVVLRRARYGGAHRPEIEYCWKASSCVAPVVN
jgi:response regulator of citrate/malate metabolism